jgi:hypothetical protein
MPEIPIRGPQPSLHAGVWTRLPKCRRGRIHEYVVLPEHSRCAMREKLAHGRGICEFAQVVLAYLKMPEAVNQVMYAATVAVFGIFRG